MTGSFKTTFFALALAGAALSAPAWAESAGKTEYDESCATCHGAAGMGEGPLAEFMSVKVPDLTELAKNNDGTFPFLEVVHVIDGRTGLRGHGSDMPVWGTQFGMETETMPGDYSKVFAVRGRIMSIAYYLESIQK